jgi:putative transposase
MATIRQKLNTYAITISTFQQHRHFQKTSNAELFIATLFRYRDQGRFQLHAFAIMPDHVHALITPAMDQSTARCVQLIKGGYSFAVREESTGQIWHSGHHEHRIHDAEDFQNQVLYIANNPARKSYLDYRHTHTNYQRIVSTHQAPVFPPTHQTIPTVSVG